MTKQIDGKLNQLERLLPEGLVVDASWLAKRGYSTALRTYYTNSGWLVQPARQVYRRPRGALTWEQVVVSLQTLLGTNFIVGGRTALELLGSAHYLAQETKVVHLYGPKRPPLWLGKLQLGVDFVYHNSERLFPSAAIRKRPAPPTENSNGALATDLIEQPWGPWGWKLKLSSAERAVLELLDELPDNETFHQVDKLTESLSTLSPRRLEGLLQRCRSVKVKRLFFFFADRHQHAWLRRVNKASVDLGKGKRVLVRGGKLNAAYQITVPEDLNGVQ